jgi:hypothetical protein
MSQRKSHPSMRNTDFQKRFALHRKSELPVEFANRFPRIQDQLSHSFVPGEGNHFLHQHSPDSLSLTIGFNRDLTDFPDAGRHIVSANEKTANDDSVFKDRELTILTFRFQIGSSISQPQRVTEDPLTKFKPVGIRRIITVTTGDPADIHGTGKGSMGMTELLETIEAFLDDIETRGVAETY